jgi:hypothetical protein
MKQQMNAQCFKSVMAVLCAHSHEKKSVIPAFPNA